jgi:hypothetical protein
VGHDDRELRSPLCRPCVPRRKRASFCRRRTGPRHTAQEQPFEVVIQYPHHPRASERVLVLRRVIHGARVHFVIEQPDGCRVLLPAWMTETYAAALPMVQVPRLSLVSLRELRSLIDAQRVWTLAVRVLGLIRKSLPLAELVCHLHGRQDDLTRATEPPYLGMVPVVVSRSDARSFDPV